MKRAVLALSLALAAPAIAFAGLADHVARKEIGGIDVIAYPTAIRDVVTLVGAMPAGTALALADDKNAAVAAMTARMLDRGTTKEDKFAIARKLDDAGASIRFSTRDQSLYIQARCLERDLPLVLQLVADQLRLPAFSQDEFERARQQFIGQLKNQSDDVQARSVESFKRAVFPAGHPNYEPSIAEYLSAAQALTLEEVKAFHREHYGPENLSLIFVGDVSLARAGPAVAKVFRGWSGGASYLRDPKPATLTDPREQNIALEMPGKTSTFLTIGQATGLHANDPDSLALEVGTAILGGGLTGRLMQEIRTREGLTYHIDAQLANNAFSDGSWQIMATFAPQLLDRGATFTQHVVQHWWKEGVTTEELKDRKTNLIGTYQVGLATTLGMATKLLSAVQAGRDVTWLDEYPKAVQALTIEEVNGAIKKHLNPATMVSVKTGTLPK